MKPSTDISKREKGKNLLYIAIVLVVAVAAFFPALKNDFAQIWDDDVYVTNNPYVKALTWENTKNIFSTYCSGNYHPLTVFSYSIEHFFFGLNPAGYHITNLILHLLNCILVFWFVHLLSRNAVVCVVAALLFAVHPSRVETVAWISDRKDLLYCLFLLASLITYLYYQRERTLKLYALCLFLFFLSLLSKGMGITFPFVLLLCDALADRKFKANLITEKIPFFGLALLFGLLTLLARIEYQSVLGEQLFEHSYFDPLFRSFHKLVFYYLYGLFVPIKISYIYPNVTGPDAGKAFLSIFFAAVIALIFIAGFFHARKYSKKIAFAGFFFLITIFPSLTVVNLGPFSDRFSYVPFVGLFYFAGEAFFWIYRKVRQNQHLLKISLVSLLAVIIVLLSVVTFQWCKVWKDSLTLCDAVIELYPDIPLYYLERGNLYERKNMLDKALADYSEAIRRDPAFVYAYFNRGNIYKQKGELDQAVADYSQAIAIKPDFDQPYCARGIVYAKKGAKEKALSDFTKALSINPDNGIVYYFRAMLFAMNGKYGLAKKDIEKMQRLRHTIPPEMARFIDREMIKRINSATQNRK